jgi:hypothetical protein
MSCDWRLQPRCMCTYCISQYCLFISNQSINPIIITGTFNTHSLPIFCHVKWLKIAAQVHLLYLPIWILISNQSINPIIITFNAHSLPIIYHVTWLKVAALQPCHVTEDCRLGVCTYIYNINQSTPLYLPSMHIRFQSSAMSRDWRLQPTFTHFSQYISQIINQPTS